MNPTSTSVGKDLKNMLMAVSRYEFQNKCFEVLSEIYPTLKNANFLGEADKKGLDLYVFDEDLKYDIVFQCKGNEVAEFKQKHKKECFESIASFSNSGLYTKKFVLVINRYIRDNSIRIELQSQLAELVKSGHAGSSLLLPIDEFIKFIFEHVESIILEKIKNANQKFESDFNERMEMPFYYSDVPFQLTKKTITNSEIPTEYIVKEISNKNKSQSAKSLWYFVVSEFGFGKTSLLLNLYKQISNLNKAPIYLPISQFKPTAFVTTSDVCENMLNVIYDNQIEYKEPFKSILIKTFQMMLKRNNNIVLLFDGLDEHPNFYTQEGLHNIFNCVRDFNSTCVFSSRKEFFEERSGDFDSAVGKTRTHKDIITLSEWRNDNIVDYIDQYIQRADRTLKTNEVKRVKHFIDLVNSNSYEAFYGDIPKRPLFLKMIIQDILTGEIKKRRLSELYQNYLMNKYQHDQSFSIPGKISRRPLDLRGDVYSRIHVIFRLLSEIAISMIDIDSNNDVVLQNTVDERTVTQLINSLDVQIKDISQLLLNSVLIPFNRRSISGIKMKFAHRSFQEYFIANHLFNLLKESTIPEQKLSLFNVKYYSGIVTFVAGMIEASFKENDDLYIKQNLRKMYSNDLDDGSLIAKLEKYR